MSRNISFVKHAKAKAHTKMTLTDIPSLVPHNYIEEELIEVIPDTNNKPLRRSLFEEFDLDEVKIDQQQLSQEIEKSSDDGNNVWNDSSIKLLIELRREKDNLFASARNKNRLWEDISKEMSKNGYNGFNANICSSKWRGLKYQFNKVHDNGSGKVTGKGRLTWKFYDLMNEFLGSTSNVSPAKGIFFYRLIYLLILIFDIGNYNNIFRMFVFYIFWVTSFKYQNIHKQKKNAG